MISARRWEIENPNLQDMGQLVKIAQDIRTPMICLFLQLLRIDYEKNPDVLKTIELVSRTLGIIELL